MDPIADFINTLKNAGYAGHSTVTVPHSNLKVLVAEVLSTRGFIKSFSKKNVKNPKGTSQRKMIDIELAPAQNGKPKIKGTKRVSKPSKRVYLKYTEIRPVKNGFGLLVVSTPRGVLAGDDARKEKVGGEVMFQIW